MSANCRVKSTMSPAETLRPLPWLLGPEANDTCAASAISKGK